MASDSDTDDDSEPESYFYGLESAEKVAALDMLPAPAEREAGRLYRKMQTMNDEEVEVVVRTYNNGNRVLQGRACARCGMRTNEKMATPGHVFCESCGGKKQESMHRAEKEGNKAKRDANEPVLRALMEEKGVERAPDNVTDAEYNVVYARLNRKKGFQPYLCMRQSNSYTATCPCGKIKSACVKCSPMYGRKNVCFNCDEKHLDAKAVRNGKMLCATCEAKFRADGNHVPGKTITTEKRFFDLLAPLVTYADGTPCPWDQRDQRRDGGFGTPSLKKRNRECDTDTVYYPDCLYLRYNKEGRIILAIVIECDEHSHRNWKYIPSCEAKKVDSVFRSIQKRVLDREKLLPDGELGRLCPVVFIRVNPDACDATPRVCFEDRVRVVAAAIKHYMWMNESFLHELGVLKPVVHFMYYHSVHGAKHLDYVQELGERWEYLGNVCYENEPWLERYDAVPPPSPATASLPAPSPAPSRPASPESPCARLVGTHNAEASCSTDPM